MNGHPCDSNSVRLKLTLPECQQLDRLLTQQLDSTEKPELNQCADRVLTMVEDAHAVAVWLGEDPVIELSSKDAMLVLEILEICRQSATTAQQEWASLQSVCAALAEFQSVR